MMQRGFSLVELSIVLVILGLLTGGILAGQSLIRAAELRAVVSEFQRYATAVQAFKDRYMALPGDMRNAESFWGTAHATDATCITTVGTGTQTCNGDGDGNFWEESTRSNERMRFWQHLANAGLIEGSYSGVGGPGNYWDTVLGTNAPPSKMGNAGWTAMHYTYAGNAVYSDGAYDRTLSFGADVASSWTYAAALKPEETWNIDTKLDDGLPQKGKVWAVRWDTCTDAANSTVTTASYLLADTSVQCGVAFIDAF